MKEPAWLRTESANATADAVDDFLFSCSPLDLILLEFAQMLEYYHSQIAAKVMPRDLALG